VRLVESVGYQGAGTVEFVADEQGTLWFLEVNARLQVEHPVTEMVTDLDLVEWQLRIAHGERLPSDLNKTPHGHAIEARIYAENPAKKFMPQPGTLTELVWPTDLPGIRIETGVREGDAVTPFYDPMIAKLVAHGESREQASERLLHALEQTKLTLTGPRGKLESNLQFLQSILKDSDFSSGNYDTLLAERLL
jgi:acetyl/propionyl-CoA carboxylase alpha subunit